MQRIKDKVHKYSNVDKQNFMVGSGIGGSQNPNSVPTPTAPLGSFKNPESAQNVVQAYDSQQENPYIQHQEASYHGAENPYVQHQEASYHGAPGGNSSQPSMYPNIYNDGQQQQGAGGYEEQDILTGAQVLVEIPGAVVHLIDDEESLHLATGDFSLVRLVQEKTQVAVIAKVGDELKWPLVQEEPTVKLDPTHYFFSLKVPRDMDDDHSSRKTDSASDMETLNYGLTLPAGMDDQQMARIRDLDYFLERYSMFSAPTIVQGSAREAEALDTGNPRDPNPSFTGKVVAAEIVSSSATVVVDEEESAAFWTTVAPNVDDYNSRLARWIATGTGHFIRQIFVFSDATVAQLDSAPGYMKSKFKPKKDKSKISPMATGGVRSVRRLSSMTDKVAGGVLGGILYTTGLVARGIVNSPPGKIFFKTAPGEVILVSLDAFGTMFDAIEKGGRDVLSRSSSVTQDFVNYRYGESAKELTDESFRSVGHAASTAWTLAKIQKAFNPKALVSKGGMAKTIGKQAVKANKETNRGAVAANKEA